MDVLEKLRIMREALHLRPAEYEVREGYVLCPVISSRRSCYWGECPSTCNRCMKHGSVTLTVVCYIDGKYVDEEHYCSKSCWQRQVDEDYNSMVQRGFIETTD